jgi:hypothetical protein
MKLPIEIHRGQSLTAQSSHLCIERVAFHTLSTVHDAFLDLFMPDLGAVRSWR